MATIPSIAMIPSGVKASKLYSVLPTDGAGDFTTTRASVATRVNENGLIEEVASNVPRLDYSDGTCPSLLLEPTATNLITYSEDFSNVSWTKAGNTVVTLNNAISPDGTLNASTVTGLDGTGGNDLGFIKSGSTANNTYTYSVYLKGSGTLRIQLSNGVDQAFENNLTLTSNWKRHYLTSTFGATATSNLYGNLDDLSATATTFEIWGAQLEENSYATSYIKNAGTALGVTRVADTASGSGSSTVINSTEGVLYAEISALANDGIEKVFSLNSGSFSNRVQIGYTAISNQINAFVQSNGVYSLNVTEILSDTTQINKIAVRYSLNNFSLWVNGVEVGTSLSGNTPIGLNNLDFSISNAVPFYGKTKSVQVYTTALSDAELTSLTTI